MITFRLSPRSGVAPYLQLVQQVRQAIRMGVLTPGDQLPTVREVVSSLTINPNTVLKAYRELEHAGLVSARPGVGTFVLREIAGPPVRAQIALRRALERWLQTAFDAGLDIESVTALFETAIRSAEEAGVA